MGLDLHCPSLNTSSRECGGRRETGFSNLPTCLTCPSFASPALCPLPSHTGLLKTRSLSSEGKTPFHLQLFIIEGQSPRRGGCWAKAALLSFQEMFRAAVKARDVAFFFFNSSMCFSKISSFPTPHPTTNFRIRPKPSYCPLFLLGKYYIYSRCRSGSLQTSNCFRKTNLL